MTINKLIANSIISLNTNQLTGNISTSQLEPTGVTANTYGGAANIPVVTVDQQGRITSASNVVITIPSSALTTDVALGTQTSGAYVANLVAGTGVILSDLGNESTTPTISIGQAVGTNNNVTFANVTVTGNLTVQGNAVIFESNTLVIIDPLIQVGKNPVGDTVDLGFFGHYIGGSPNTERHAGLFRDATDGQFKLFTNLDPEPTTIVDTANASYQSANLVVDFVVGKVSDISNHTTASLAENSANLYFTNNRVYANVIQLDYASNTYVNAREDFLQNTFMIIAVSDETTTLTTGNGKVRFRAPFGMTLWQTPRASVNTASTSGVITIDIDENGSSIFSTRLTIDANEKTSTTAATPAVLSDTSIADDAEITVDIIGAGTGANGLKVTLYYSRT